MIVSSTCMCVFCYEVDIEPILWCEIVLFLVSFSRRASCKPTDHAAVHYHIGQFLQTYQITHILIINFHTNLFSSRNTGNATKLWGLLPG